MRLLRFSENGSGWWVTYISAKFAGTKKGVDRRSEAVVLPMCLILVAKWALPILNEANRPLPDKVLIPEMKQTAGRPFKLAARVS
jgi:hypothetical protein